MPTSPPSSAPRPEGRAVAVFEIMNDSTKELYIGTSTTAIDVLARELREDAPAAIRHWRGTDVVSYRCLEASISSADAEAFIAHYARCMSGYEVLLDRPSRG